MGDSTLLSIPASSSRSIDLVLAELRIMLILAAALCLFVVSFLLRHFASVRPSLRPFTSPCFVCSLLSLSLLAWKVDVRCSWANIFTNTLFSGATVLAAFVHCSVIAAVVQCYRSLTDAGFIAPAGRRAAGDLLAGAGLDASRGRLASQVLVIGNDNAEKIQILPATIARVDRNSPEYDDTNYQDRLVQLGAPNPQGRILMDRQRTRPQRF